MRIGYETTAINAAQSGVGVYTANLLEHLKQQLSRCTDPQDRIIPLTNHNQAIKSSISTPKRINKTLWMQAVLPFQLRGLQPDVCHFTNNVGPLFSPSPSVITIHDMSLWMFPQYHYRRRLLAMRPFIPTAARRATAIITVSHSVKADIVRILNVPADKVHVIYEAPPEHFRRLTNKPRLDAVRQRYGLPNQFILAVGTVEPRKNLVRLIEAFALLRKDKHFPAKLVLAGDRGWKDNPIYAAVERLNVQNDVQFLGYVPTDDLIALYNLATVVAFPSLYEGFGLPVLEAMACGTPVVASDIPALHEIAGDAPDYVEPTSIISIAVGLQRMVCDEQYRDELRRRGLVQAALYTWQTTAEQTLAVYRKALR